MKAGLLGGVSDAGVYIGLERGYYKELGLIVEPETIGLATQISQALATGAVDVGGLGMNSGIYNMVAGGIKAKVVADKGKHTRGNGYLGAVIRKDLAEKGELKNYGDLKGRTVATAPRGGSTEPIIEKILAAGGIKYDDVNWQYLTYPNMLPALANKAVDVAFILEPNMSAAVARGLGVLWKTFDEVYPNQQIAVLVFSEKFAGNPEAARRFMVGYVKGLRDFNDAFVKGQGRDDVEKILTKHTSIKDAAVYKRMVMPGFDPNGRLDVASIANDQETLAALGFVQRKVDIKELVDEQFVEYAARVLPAYK